MRGAGRCPFSTTRSRDPLGAAAAGERRRRLRAPAPAPAPPLASGRVRASGFFFSRHPDPQPLGPASPPGARTGRTLPTGAAALASSRSALSPGRSGSVPPAASGPAKRGPSRSRCRCHNNSSGNRSGCSLAVPNSPGRKILPSLHSPLIACQGGWLGKGLSASVLALWAWMALLSLQVWDHCTQEVPRAASLGSSLTIGRERLALPWR